MSDLLNSQHNGIAIIASCHVRIKFNCSCCSTFANFLLLSPRNGFLMGIKFLFRTFFVVFLKFARGIYDIIALRTRNVSIKLSQQEGN